MPALFEISEGTRDLAVEIHFYLSYGILALVAVHAGAAFKHHLADGGSTPAAHAGPAFPLTRGRPIGGWMNKALVSCHSSSVG